MERRQFILWARDWMKTRRRRGRWRWAGSAGRAALRGEFYFMHFFPPSSLIHSTCILSFVPPPHLHLNSNHQTSIALQFDISKFHNPYIWYACNRSISTYRMVMYFFYKNERNRDVYGYDLGSEVKNQS